jgi:anaerobic magnesium-protoporphyrin IX monomethyl ester cyclase
MADVVLIHPYFKPQVDKSLFRFPPLGVGYIASYLAQYGVEVQIIDCTFKTEADVVASIHNLKPQIIGIYCIIGIEGVTFKLARLVKDYCAILMVGGPYPTIAPNLFLDDFDLVVLGEGEQTVLEVAQNVKNGGDYREIPGIAYKNSENQIISTKPRQILQNLDSLPFPARDLYPNDMYQTHCRKSLSYTITPMITTRGCPFACDFCSRPISGKFYRERSKENVVDEIEEITSYGYDRIWIADDVFTYRKQYVIDICEEIISRKLKCQWECLSRVDTMDVEMALKMQAAGCVRVFFGIESGNDTILRAMNKNINTEQAFSAVNIAKKAGLSVGGFFILGYPEETDNTILQTLRFAHSLPLDYLSFTFPYPFPGTGLYEKVKDKLLPVEWISSQQGQVKHKLVFKSQFSETKLKFAIFKGMAQFGIKKRLGQYDFGIAKIFATITDWIFRSMK